MSNVSTIAHNSDLSSLCCVSHYSSFQNISSSWEYGSSMRFLGQLLVISALCVATCSVLDQADVCFNQMWDRSPYQSTGTTHHSSRTSKKSRTQKRRSQMSCRLWRRLSWTSSTSKNKSSRRLRPSKRPWISHPCPLFQPDHPLVPQLLSQPLIHHHTKQQMAVATVHVRWTRQTRAVQMIASMPS